MEKTSGEQEAQKANGEEKKIHIPPTFVLPHAPKRGRGPTFTQEVSFKVKKRIFVISRNKSYLRRVGGQES